MATIEIKRNSMSFFSGDIKELCPDYSMTINDYVGLVKDEWIQEIQQKYDEAEAGEQKRSIKIEEMPHVTPHCIVTKRKSDCVESMSDLMMIDIDKIPNLEKRREQLQNDPYITVLHLTISGKGLRGLICIDLSQGEFKQYFLAVEKYFDSEYSIQIDKACKDIVRAAKLAYDSNVYFNEESTIVNKQFLDQWLPKTTVENETKTKMRTVNATNNCVDLTEEQKQFYGEQKLKRSCDKVRKAPDGTKHSVLFKESARIGNFIHYGLITIDQATEALEKAICENEGNVDDIVEAQQTIFDGIKRGVLSPQPIDNEVVTNEKRFWRVIPKEDGKKDLKIPFVETYRLLQKNGFGLFRTGTVNRLVKADKNILSEVRRDDIIQFMMKHIASLPHYIDEGVTRYELEELFRKRLPMLFSESQLSTNIHLIPAFNRDTKEDAYLYFKDKVVKVTKNAIEAVEYDQLNGIIWGSKLIDTEIGCIDFDLNQARQGSDFVRFLLNVCNQDEIRFDCMCRLIGYLLHAYKDPHLSKAVIFCDEMVSDVPNGGTGKGIVLEALAKLKKLALIDGKNFKFGGQFSFQQVELDTDMMVFEDVTPNFKFEQLFSVITQGISVEKKNKDKFHINFEDSPKMLITTNYMVLGNGNSHERRKLEFEFSSHYNSEKTPYDEFGRNLYNDWENDQWQYFYGFMIHCLQQYLLKSVAKPPQINIKKRKLIQQSDVTFVEYCTKYLKLGVHYEKQKLYKDYTDLYSDVTDLKWFNQRTFNRWLRAFAEAYEYECLEWLSNNRQYISFKAGANPSERADSKIE